MASVSVCEKPSGVDFPPVITIFKPGIAVDTGPLKFSKTPAQRVSYRSTRLSGWYGRLWRFDVGAKRLLYRGAGYIRLRHIRGQTGP